MREGGGTRPAVFLDRDGTLVVDSGFLHQPEQLALLPGAARAVRRLNQAQVPVVTVTNQSGIARGLYGVDDYRAVERRLAELLAGEGARIDASYFCPHHPEITGPCACRKPGTALFEEAARAMDLDLPGSWWIGDRVRDLLPARHFGGHGVLVEAGRGASDRAAAAGLGFATVPSLDRAVTDQVLRYLAQP